MKCRWWKIVTVVGLLSSAVFVASSASAHPTVATRPDARSSLGSIFDQWRLRHRRARRSVGLLQLRRRAADPDRRLGEQLRHLRWAGGVLTVDARNGSTVKLVRTWGQTLPWGRDGLVKPIDAGDLQPALVVGLTCRSGPRHRRAVLSPNPAQSNVSSSSTYPAGRQRARLRSHPTGPVRTERLVGQDHPSRDLPSAAATAAFRSIPRCRLDWVRLHRAECTRRSHAGAAPIVSVVSPSEEGGADYATVSGNAWDFAGPDDVVSIGDITNGIVRRCQLQRHDRPQRLVRRVAAAHAADHRPIPPADRRRLYGGGFSLEGAPGGGMDARVGVVRRGWADLERDAGHRHLPGL